MNEELLVHLDAEESYRQAERKAAGYFAALYEQVAEKTYIPALTEDFKQWKRSHLRHRPRLFDLMRHKQQSNSQQGLRYIQKLNESGKLDDYLDRSVSYMYMRDLGKDMTDHDTKDRIRRTAAGLKNQLLRHNDAKHERLDRLERQTEFLTLKWLYRWAQKEGIESAVIWVIEKLQSVSSHIPKEMNAEHAERKLIKIIFGVVLHVMEEMDIGISTEERARQLDEAIRLGHSYGLTYPFIDDLLDSQALTAQEKERYSDMIRTSLLTGMVPDLGEWSGANKELMRFVHSELHEAFDYIKSRQRPETLNLFFEQTYVFFHSQELDRDKVLSHTGYTNEELYLPIILKSASSRLIARSVISAPLDEGFYDRTFYYGIYNQLADDLADLDDDLQEGAVTPYTYYLMHRQHRPDLLNPFELYWAVIAYLIHHVYRSDVKTREIILNRAINGLKRCKTRIGAKRYDELMNTLASGIPEFDRLIQRMVRKASDVEFFDKLLRDQLAAMLRNDRKQQEAFLNTIEKVRAEIDNNLQIAKDQGMTPMKEPLIDAANYSLAGGGKRLRPILTWMIGVDHYGLPAPAIVPLLRSLEYMHTASLIFDDLPSQDNASTRRGRPTLHQVHSVATAELTGLYLIQKAIQEQASLKPFDAKAVLALVHYSAYKAEELCMGQEMDLRAKGQVLTLEQLNTICYYKTAAAFEAALVMPAILAQADEKEIAVLNTFAYHAGIAFQIKDDLLDFEGDMHVLGKPIGQDAQNNNPTFVSVLGPEGAKKEMWRHYCMALEALEQMPRRPDFLRHLLNYMVHRNV